MKVIFQTFLLIALIAFSSTLAFSCSSGSQDERFERAKAVFLGKVVTFKKRTEKLSKDFDFYPFDVTFKVEKQWKGKKQSEIFALASYDWEGMCGDLNLRVGERFLIYAFHRGGKFLILRDCSPNREAKYAKDEIKRLDDFCSNDASSTCVKKLKEAEEKQKKLEENNDTSNNSMDVRAKQLLSYSRCLLTLRLCGCRFRPRQRRRSTASFDLALRTYGESVV